MASTQDTAAWQSLQDTEEERNSVSTAYGITDTAIWQARLRGPYVHRLSETGGRAGGRHADRRLVVVGRTRRVVHANRGCVLRRVHDHRIRRAHVGKRRESGLLEDGVTSSGGLYCISHDSGTAARLMHWCSRTGALWRRRFRSALDRVAWPSRPGSGGRAQAGTDCRRFA